MPCTTPAVSDLFTPEDWETMLVHALWELYATLGEFLRGKPRPEGEDES